MTTRIQRRNRRIILDAALEVFSSHGFRGATLDQIADQAGLSKPNLLYYFDGKEAIHRALLTELLHTWLDPLREIDPRGDPQTEILAYMRRKLSMSRKTPRESRLFANEIIQGAPRIESFLRGDLKSLVDEKAAILRDWAQGGRIARVDPYHLIFSVWALTQHYADFEAQIRMIRGPDHDPTDGAEPFLEHLYTRLLAPDSPTP
ncbi:TetR family transcriptional regulator C-terminal domain-containing protein [Rhodobacteraceae bacterium 2376]|uniref:TetR family transcriptional regulator C-terminal domain-containing protein n=1 Tax=Rhabdonatronobacter sediminivivens TaxID=2743469 RepID=A0A7Z0HWN5_9RHOB|nr:TetR family transcriptional regulator C-terminal domain-containing protein [Rhabdonatronobacter sediminivivens]NYS23515.1 TetR family transcriptional regulator C-terminal domain-containing protein [Rhabdonatronobacter sediminivivens]